MTQQEEEEEAAAAATAAPAAASDGSKPEAPNAKKAPLASPLTARSKSAAAAAAAAGGGGVLATLLASAQALSDTLGDKTAAGAAEVGELFEGFFDDSQNQDDLVDQVLSSKDETLRQLYEENEALKAQMEEYRQTVEQLMWTTSEDKERLAAERATQQQLRDENAGLLQRCAAARPPNRATRPTRPEPRQAATAPARAPPAAGRPLPIAPAEQLLVLLRRRTVEAEDGFKRAAPERAGSRAARAHPAVTDAPEQGQRF